MSTYTQSDSSILGSSYFQGIIYPWDEYIVIPVSDTQSVLVVGTYDGRSGDQISFKDSKIYTVNRSGSYGSSYSTSYSEESSTTVNVSEPYYIYSNTFAGAPALNCTQANSIMAYFVCFAVLFTVISQIALNLIKSLLRRSSYD